MTEENVKEFVKAWARYEAELTAVKPAVLSELKSNAGALKFVEGLYGPEGRLGKGDDRRKVAYHLALANFHATFEDS